MLFFRKIFRSDGGICFSMAPFWILGHLGVMSLKHIFSIGSKYFSKKKM